MEARGNNMMGMAFHSFYPCVPPKTTAQQHKRIFYGKNGKAFLGTDKKGVATQNELAAIFLTNRPPEDFPRDLPIRSKIVFVFPYRKSEKKALVKAGKFIPHTSRPDGDNLHKGCADVLTRCGFWNDDSQVYDMSIQKFYGPNPGIWLHIYV